MKESHFTYPRLNIDLSKVSHNVKNIVEICNKNGIEVTGVIKGFDGLYRVAEEFIKGGCTRLGTSRLDQIIELKNRDIHSSFFLMRTPMMSEIKKVVEYADISLNSELDVLKEINSESILQNKKHKVVLMTDVGDLRDGYWDKNELIDVACYVENDLDNIELYGIATHVGCYGSIMPTEKNMNELCNLAEIIEKKINRKLEIISGGATTSLSLVVKNKMPKRINDLRIGEGIIIARDLHYNWDVDMSNMHRDIFIVQAQIIEVKYKPTHPVGEIFSIDPFGNTREYYDKGIRKRAILAIGRLDFSNEQRLIPKVEGIEIIGASSDHLIIDVENYKDNLKAGDVLEFYLDYEAMMHLTISKYVDIVYK